MPEFAGRGRSVVVPERSETTRDRIREALLDHEASARELSGEAGVSEKEVIAHLEHLARSARARGERLVVTPSACLGCQFVFHARDRLTKPGSCPVCRRTRISPPRFRIQSS